MTEARGAEARGFGSRTLARRPRLGSRQRSVCRRLRKQQFQCSQKHSAAEWPPKVLQMFSSISADDADSGPNRLELPQQVQWLLALEWGSEEEVEAVVGEEEAGEAAAGGEDLPLGQGRLL